MMLQPDEDEDLQQDDDRIFIDTDDTEEKSVSIEPITPPRERE